MRVLAISFPKGRFARRAMDPRDPERQQAFGEDDGGHELGEDGFPLPGRRRRRRWWPGVSLRARTG